MVVMEVSYDEEADVLYIKLKECENPDTEHRDDDVLIRRDTETGEIVGYSVIRFKERDTIELPEIAEVPA